MTTNTLRASMLWYYIPSGRGIKNPAGKLNSLSCVSMDGSVWLVLDSMVATVNAKVVRPLEASGARVGWVRFDERDVDSIIATARYAMTARAAMIRAGIEASVASIMQKLSGIASNDAEGRKKVERHAYSTTWRARKMLTDLRECALLFDLTGEFAPLFDATHLVIKTQDALLWQKVKGAVLPSPSVLNLAADAEVSQAIAPIFAPPTEPEFDMTAAIEAHYAPTTTDGESHRCEDGLTDEEFDATLGNGGEPLPQDINEDEQKDEVAMHALAADEVEPEPATPTTWAWGR